MRHFSGEFPGMRLLMLDELDAIAGGGGEDTDTVAHNDVSEVVVTATTTGTTYSMPLFTNFSSWGGWSGAVQGDGNPNTTDSESVSADINFTRPLTGTEQAAVNSLVQSIRDGSELLASIPDSAHVTMWNGQTVTGAELKQMWQNTDFTINEAGHVYANGTTRGEANYNNGNPQISINIDTLVGYAANGPIGTNYVVLHELGHMTVAGRAFLTSAYSDGVFTAQEDHDNELLANDIARGIGSSGGVNANGDWISMSIVNSGPGFSGTLYQLTTP